MLYKRNDTLLNSESESDTSFVSIISSTNLNFIESIHASKKEWCSVFSYHLLEQPEEPITIPDVIHKAEMILKFFKEK